MKEISNPYGDGCFFCGSLNPVGLRLTFQETEGHPNELVCRWVPSATFKGLGQILHGGIQSGLFDEIMGWSALHMTGRQGVTVSLQVNFLRPVFVEQEIEVRCRVDRMEGDKVHLIAEIVNEEGEVCTRGTGAYLLMDPDRFRNLVRLDDEPSLPEIP